MTVGTPFIIDNPTEEFENHSRTEKGETGSPKELPFEFSRTRMWNESLYSPEIGGGHSIASLEKELGEIKLLITDIKNILKDIFEV